MNRLTLTRDEYNTFVNSRAWLAILHEIDIRKDILRGLAKKEKDRDARLDYYDRVSELDNMTRLGRDIATFIGEPSKTASQDEAELREKFKGEIQWKP
jgi:hypothetical protein